MKQNCENCIKLSVCEIWHRTMDQSGINTKRGVLGDNPCQTPNSTSNLVMFDFFNERLPSRCDEYCGDGS